MRLAEKKAVRYLKAITCNNLVAPLGMGLWEGVPLREVLWLAQPRENIRQIFYHGYHNDDPKQMFQCWLPINRVLEDLFARLRTAEARFFHQSSRLKGQTACHLRTAEDTAFEARFRPP